MSAARFVISGKVQGVWFRASAREQALSLGLRGFARNLDDGSVEVLAAGDEAAIETLATWLRHGPPQAQVDTVMRSHAGDAEAGRDFTIG